MCIVGWKSLPANANKRGHTHYWILGCVAAVGTARGGGQMKDDCTAVGALQRVCFFFSLLVSVCTCPCGSKASEAVSLAAQTSKDVCHTVLIKRQQHPRLPLVLGLICSIQITNINQRRQISPQTTSLCCSFVLFLFISPSLWFLLWQQSMCSLNGYHGSFNKVHTVMELLSVPRPL